MQCHGGRAEPTTQRCLTCHKEIAWLRQQQRGFHARGSGQGACSTCHPDHAGRDFQLIQWPGGAPERFDHARGAGYALEQSHASAKCTACHTPRLRTSPVASLSPRRSGAGWVGLERDCASCHTDPHRGSLTGACTRCHDTGRWKDAPAFDHAKTDYPLTGKHGDVACAKCHLAARLRPPTDSAGRPTPVFRPVPFKDCSSCHASPHEGSLTGSCSKCHVTSSFKTIDRAAFDHDRTRYPLRGRHADVSCASCHGSATRSIARPRFTTCASCHRDPHDGEATIAGKTVDCASCHRVDGFTPATFSVAQHRGTAFPLLGRHAAVPCASCHSARAATPRLPNAAGADVPARRTAASATVPIRMASARCTDCHGDAHGSQLVHRTDGGACTACHSVEGWKPVTFGTAAHATLRLALDGAHVTIPCSSCHAAKRPGLRPLGSELTAGSAHVAIRPPETSCADCHADPHVWSARHATTASCSTCHTTRAFRPTTMDAARHASTGYPLEGAHRAAPCVACHRQVDRPRAGSTLIAAPTRITPLRLDSVPATCNGCHTDPHRGRFTSVASGSCDGCHTIDAFKPAARFDHARIARFPLEGAHQRVRCTACHRQPLGTPPGSPLVYEGLSRKCESCHVGSPARPRGPA